MHSFAAPGQALPQQEDNQSVLLLYMTASLDSSAILCLTLIVTNH